MPLPELCMVHCSSWAPLSLFFFLWWSASAWEKTKTPMHKAKAKDNREFISVSPRRGLVSHLIYRWDNSQQSPRQKYRLTLLHEKAPASDWPLASFTL
jgi:hypothetical protein